MRFCVVALCAGLGVTVGCSSSSQSDGGTDSGVSDCSIASDASFSCDVSAVNPNLLGCGDWVGVASPQEGGGYACPSAVDWSASLSGSGLGGNMCEYTWDFMASPNLCDLPQAYDGTPAFTWLQPVCACP